MVVAGWNALGVSTGVTPVGFDKAGALSVELHLWEELTKLSLKVAPAASCNPAPNRATSLLM